MLSHVARRLLVMIPVVFFVTILNFLIIIMVPGDPVDTSFNPNASAADNQAKRTALGLYDPVPVRYGKWLIRVLHGDLGYSFATYESVGSILGERIGPTLLLMGTAMLIAYAFAIPIGIVSATKQYTPLDYAMTGFSFIGISVPAFFFGLFGIYLFALKLRWLPTGGMATLGGSGGFLDRAWHLVLPAMVLAFAISGKMVRYVRSSMLDVLGKDYLRTARAKGLREISVTGRHALRNALVPIITVIGLDIPLLIGGAVVTEQIFQWPGIGQLTIQAIGSRDYPVLMAINLVSALVVIAANLLTDVLYVVVDPRIRLE
jgi:peptide/nickel transport system permease protein